MSAVNVTIQGVIMVDGESKPCTIIGSAFLTDVGIGGGPIIPPEQPPVGGGKPPRPQFPIALPPDFVPPGPGYPDYIWGAPIIPPPQVPPDINLPPGSVIVPPGSPNQPVNPIVVPKFILVNYPGFGWVIVTPPPVGNAAKK